MISEKVEPDAADFAIIEEAVIHAKLSKETIEFFGGIFSRKCEGDSARGKENARERL